MLICTIKTTQQRIPQCNVENVFVRQTVRKILSTTSYHKTQTAVCLTILYIVVNDLCKNFISVTYQIFESDEHSLIQVLDIDFVSKIARRNSNHSKTSQWGLLQICQLSKYLTFHVVTFLSDFICIPFRSYILFDRMFHLNNIQRKQ